MILWVVSGYLRRGKHDSEELKRAQEYVEADAFVPAVQVWNDSVKKALDLRILFTYASYLHDATVACSYSGNQHRDRLE